MTFKRHDTVEIERISICYTNDFSEAPPDKGDLFRVYLYFSESLRVQSIYYLRIDTSYSLEANSFSRYEDERVFMAKLDEILEEIGVEDNYE